MPFYDRPQTIPFILFLLIFIVIGIYPAWKKTAAMIRKALKENEQHNTTPTVQLQDHSATATQLRDLQLSDFDNFVLWQLAQNQPKCLTGKQLNATLHLEPADLKNALRSLADNGLIYLELSSWFKLRYRLSETGYQYAIEQGFITSLHDIGTS